MKRFSIGCLAVVGALSILVMGGLVLLLMAAMASKPGVPDKVLLELEVTDALIEHVGEDDFAAALTGGGKPTVRDVVDALEKARTDDRVKGLVVRVATSPGSFAVTQELRDAVKAFRQSGKKAVVFADTFGEFSPGNAGYYFATAFDEVYLQPTGDLGLTGLAAETPFARDAFAKLGVKPQIGKRYEYKNAANTYTEQGYTAPHREATEKFLGSMQDQMVRGIAEDRKLDAAQVRKLMDTAPLSAQEALAAKLVDGLVYRDEAYAKAKAHAGEGAKLLFLQRYLKRAGRPNASGGDTVALVYGVGGIQRGDSDASPFGGSSFGGDSVAAALRKAIDDKSVKAIVFRVDSPGGSAVASDTVRREVRRAKEAGKPVIVSMGSVAASGGYWVSMDADKIVAQPGTITGSIGVFGGKAVTTDMWAKLGVNWDTVALTQAATFSSTDQEYTPEQLQRREAFLDRIYKDFTEGVAAGRKLPLEKVQQVAKGRVWTGEDAKGHGLVDELGGFPTALRLAKEAAKLPADKDVRVAVYPRKKEAAEILAQLLGGEQGDNSEDATGVSTRVPLVAEVRALTRTLVQLGVGTQPAARTVRAEVPDVVW